MLETGSGTAKLTMRARYMAHALGFGPDSLAHHFLPAYYETETPAWLSGLSFGLSRFEFWLTGRFSNVLSGPVAYLQARTRYLDDLVASRRPKQLVLLGAGYDTRSYRLAPCLSGEVRCIEVDAPATQASKLRCLDAAGLDRSRVTFVAVDFTAPAGEDDWMCRLLASGFDAQLPSLFIWEGVTYYLPDEAVDATLVRIASTCCSETAVAMDTFEWDMVQRSGAMMQAGFGEPFLSGTVRGQEAQLATRNGLIMHEPIVRVADMNVRFMPRRASGALVCCVHDRMACSFLVAAKP